MRSFKLIGAALIATLIGAPAIAAMQAGKKAPVPVQDVWIPAATPKGGVSWKTLEATKLIDRKDKSGIIYTKPSFTPAVLALNGKQVKVAGYMMPLENAAKQKHFVLLGYPPGCPFHTHALPNQFVEIKAALPVNVDIENVMVLTGTLQLTGQDESGIFYRLVNARLG
jgi:uncharacterized protein